jgi:pimeloyl-ACP methyl ester carboxylesterase
LDFAVAAPNRLLGGLAIDPVGGVGDGGSAEFERRLVGRLSDAERRRVEELDELEDAGAGTDALTEEGMRLTWPAYFASRDDVMPFTPLAASEEAFRGTMQSVMATLPALERALPALSTPFGFVAGRLSPMPFEEAAGATASVIPGAWLDVVDGAGHFVWYECPGRVRAALDRLVRNGSAIGSTSGR